MSLDRRLRDGLGRSPIEIDQGSLNQDLHDVVGRGRRSRRTRRMGTGAIAVAAIVAVVAIGPKALDAFRDVGETRPASPQQLRKQIAGTYTIVVDPAGGAVEAFDMAGTWTVRLLPTGAIEMIAPAAFLGTWDPPTGSLFTLSDSEFRTNALSDLCDGSIATYAWSLDKDRLSFAPITEDCDPRRSLFASSPWAQEA